MKIERIGSIEDLLGLEKEWGECLSASSHDNVFLTWEWFVSWWKCFGKGSELNILVFRNPSGTLCGLAPLKTREKILSFIAIREVIPGKTTIVPKASFVVKDSDVLIIIGEKSQLKKLNSK